MQHALHGGFAHRDKELIDRHLPGKLTGMFLFHT